MPKPRREWVIGGGLALLAVVGLTGYCGEPEPVTQATEAAPVGARLDGYSREKFGPAWFDADGNGCGQRDDVLARDLTDVRKAPGKCTVMSGVLDDPYTGSVVQFTRGASRVDIDHVVPLSYAWAHGASGWSQERRVAFANDTRNLLAVSASANRAKSDKGPSEWMPEAVGFRCAYGREFLGVAERWELRVDDADREAVAEAC